MLRSLRYSGELPGPLSYPRHEADRGANFHQQQNIRDTRFVDTEGQRYGGRMEQLGHDWVLSLSPPKKGGQCHYFLTMKLLSHLQNKMNDYLQPLEEIFLFSCPTSVKME